MKSFQIVFVSLMLLVIAGLHYYVFYRLWHMLPSTVIGRILLIAAIVFVVSSFFLGQMGGKILPSSFVSVLYRTGTSWFFIFIYLILIFVVLDLLRITHLLPVERFMYASWKGFLILTGVITFVMTCGFIRYKNKERVSIEIALHKENARSKEVKIVLLSDLHLGYGIGVGEFEDWVEQINKENPDMVLIAGDIVDNNCRPLYEQNMAQVFRKINAEQGIYAVLGNHEYVANISECIRFLNDAGVILLRDSTVLLDDLYIAGRDDKTNQNRKSIADLTASLDKTKPIILLDHQPFHLDETAANNIDIQFSGHTHHGQIVPFSWITNLIYEKAHGLLKKGNTHFYVSSGIGVWGGKFRIGTQSEYVVINLKIDGKTAVDKQ